MWEGKKQRGMGAHRGLILIGIMTMPVLLCGCSHFNESYQAGSTFEAANTLFNRGSYRDSLDTYEKIGEHYPSTKDRVLFEMGIIYAHPKNDHKDYQKALECFQQLVKDYPASSYRQDSESMIFTINNVALKDATITAQQTQIESLRHEVASREYEIASLKKNEIAPLQEKIGALEQKVFAYALQMRTADRILIEKKARRLMVLSRGEVLKTYKIALGGNPEGPKVQQGDNKTPEGCYIIDARNKESRYHLSLHLSYPNESDKRRARELGVPPGGNIMIHGLKNGFSSLGDLHTGADWTKGCIAVTDEEIEEIAKLAPNGTIVEIKP